MEIAPIHLNDRIDDLDYLSAAAGVEASIIRLGNVLLECYYSNDEVMKALGILSQKLFDCGIIIIANGDAIVYQKQGDAALVPLRVTAMLRHNRLFGKTKLGGLNPYSALQQRFHSCCVE